jgi:crooked neck
MPHDYDAWFDYARLEEEEVANVLRGADRRGSLFDADVFERPREVYERAIAQVPPVQEKRFWRRYIYLWINYALFEEMVARDIERTRAVYKGLLDTIPHGAFSFAKAFALAAHFEVRQLDLPAARRIMGQAVGRCGRLGKEKVFKDYIHLERQLGEIDRCRKLYQKYLEFMPMNCAAWGKFADLERSLGENARARAVFEVAISQPSLDMPEVLWKQYIDFEIAVSKEVAETGPDEDDLDAGDAASGLGRVRELYERLLDRTKHVKVWISYATFEATDAKAIVDAEAARLGVSVADASSSASSAWRGGGMEDSRSIFRKAYSTLKDAGLKEERVTLLEAWKNLEKQQPRAQQSLQEVAKLMPKKVKKRRLVTGDDGEEQGWEEYYDYHFPDDRSAPMNLKILELAHQWKQTGVLAGLADAGTSGGGEEVDEATRRDGPATKKARIGDDEEEIDIDDIGDS